MSADFGPYPHWHTIDDEIEDIRERPRLLNNFPGILPFGIVREAHDYMIRPENIDRALEAVGEQDQVAAHELFGDVEEAISLHGINRARIQELQQVTSRHETHYAELIALTLPVYQYLREQGYNYTELRG